MTESCPSLLLSLPLLLISIHIYAIYGRRMNISQHKIVTTSFPLTQSASVCPSCFRSGPWILLPLHIISFPPILFLFFSSVAWLPGRGWFIWTILPALWDSAHHHNGMVHTLTCTRQCKRECTHRLLAWCGPCTRAHTQAYKDGEVECDPTHLEGWGMKFEWSSRIMFYIELCLLCIKNVSPC